MGEMWRIFKLLIYKNMVVRRNRWKFLLFVEFMIPLLLILLGQIVRTLVVDNPTRISHSNYHEITPAEPAPRKGFQLRYAPKNDLTDRIMIRTGQCMRIHDNQLIGSESESLMVKEIMAQQDIHPHMTFFGIVFEDFDNGDLPTKFRYKVRTSTRLPQDLYQNMENGNAATSAFAGSPFTLMQMCLDKAYIIEALPPFPINITMTTQQMPYPPFIYVDSWTILGGSFISEFAKLMFFIIMLVEFKFPFNEKNSGINILMAVNGVKNAQTLLSWLISGVMFSVVYLAPIVIMLKYFLPPILSPYLAYSNGFMVWIVLTIHVCHIMAFAMHTTALIHSQPFLVVVLILGLMDIINIYVSGAKYARLVIYLGILDPTSLMKGMFNEISFYENQLIGVDWNNLFAAGDAMAPPESSLGALVVFSILGILIHTLLTVYLYEERFEKFGVAQHPLYFLLKRKKVRCEGDVMLSNYNREDRKEFERVPEGTLTPGIQIRDVTKSHVTDVHFYKGQITALLSLVGDGKTAMISVLSSLTGSTKGTARIDGKNVQHDLESVQRNVGFCPQENIVFPHLTVFEQVMFFGMLKAGGKKTKDDLTMEVEILLEKVNLTGKKNSLMKQLSTRQQRMMCLAMAVVGGASVLILDEPTSGMDVEGKREVRDILLKLRGDRTILISTHDAETAEILGDRIAIIHSGKMRCYGTSMFLKKLYGDGQVEVTLSTEPSCEPQRIVGAIGLSAQLLNADNGIVVLAVPFADNLPEVLDTLEKRKSELGIISLSVSLITLEQVFLRVTRDKVNETDFSMPSTNDFQFAKSFEKRGGFRYFVQTVIAFFVKKFRMVLLWILTIFRHARQTTSSHDVEFAKSFDKLTGFRYFVQTVIAFSIKKYTFTRKKPWVCIVYMLLPCISAIVMVLVHSGSSDIRSSSLTLDAYTDTRSIARVEEKIYGEKYVTSAEGFGGAATYIGPYKNLTDVLLASAVDDLRAYRKKFIVSGEFNMTHGNIVANGFYSGTALLGVPVTVNMLTNTIVKVLTGDDEYSISISAEELPRSYGQLEMPADESFILTLTLTIFLGIAVTQYVTQPLQENLSGLKELQAVTGASSFAYWGCTYLFDLLQYTVSIVLLVAAFVIADASIGTRYYQGTEILIFFLLLFLFGVSALPLIYMYSFCKTTTIMTRMNIASLVLILVNSILDQCFTTVNDKWYQWYHFFRDVDSRILLLWPVTSIYYGHESFFKTVIKNSRCRRMPNKLIEVACPLNSSSLGQCCDMKCWDGVCKNPSPYFVSDDNFIVLPDSLMWMAVSAVLFFGIIYVLEKKILAKLYVRWHRATLNGTVEMTDELVGEEADKVTTEIAKVIGHSNCEAESNPKHRRNENIFFVRRLSKSRGSLNVVKGISFRVKHGECLGLLGVNGAGKSTIYRMLIGEELPNSGEMYLNDYSLNIERKNGRRTGNTLLPVEKLNFQTGSYILPSTLSWTPLKDAQRYSQTPEILVAVTVVGCPSVLFEYLAEMGYCPQQNAILGPLNSRDHLYLIARLRGIPKPEVKATVEKWIHTLNLTACASQPSETYSEGNRRRLNIAMALIGNPSLVILDEPTTGMDPAERRSLWKTLKTCQEGGQSIILTSQSIEECEALCNRLVIMTKGRLACVGASQELKQRFNAGYNIHVKLNPRCQRTDVEKITHRIDTILACKFTDENTGSIDFHVTDRQATWTKMYTMMNELKVDYDCIEDFTVLSSTLEQLFIQFARASGDADETDLANDVTKRRWWRKNTSGFRRLS